MHSRWRRWALVFAALAVAAAAHAADWSAWQPVPDKYQNGIEIRYKQGRSKNNGTFEWSYQLRNRYNRNVSSKIELVEDHADGPKKVSQTFVLDAGEQEKQERRVVCRAIRQAYVVDVQFGPTAAVDPTAGPSDRAQLEKVLAEKRKEVTRLERQRLEADREAGRIRAAAATPTGRGARDGVSANEDDNPGVGPGDIALADQNVRQVTGQLDGARRVLATLEKQMEAIKQGQPAKNQPATSPPASPAGQTPAGPQGDTEALVNAAQKAAGENKWADAERSYRTLAQQDPGNAAYHANLAVTLLNQNKTAEAEAPFRKAVEIDPNNARFRDGLGNTLLEQNKFGEAAAVFREAARLAPGDAGYHYKAGAALVKQDKFGEAETLLREAVRLEPNSALHQSWLSIALSRLNKWADAETALRAAARLEPTVAQHRGNLGLALINQNKFADAEVAYREASRLDPKNESYRQQLHLVQEKQSKKPQ